jgi:hypothetical protein
VNDSVRATADVDASPNRLSNRGKADVRQLGDHPAGIDPKAELATDRYVALTTRFLGE